MPFYRLSLHRPTFSLSLSLWVSVSIHKSGCLKGVYTYASHRVESFEEKGILKVYGKRHDFLSKSDNRNSIVVNDDRETSARDPIRCKISNSGVDYDMEEKWIKRRRWYRFQWAHKLSC